MDNPRNPFRENFMKRPRKLTEASRKSAKISRKPLDKALVFLCNGTVYRATKVPLQKVMDYWGSAVAPCEWHLEYQHRDRFDRKQWRHLGYATTNSLDAILDKSTALD